jgi:hypothetical protein
MKNHLFDFRKKAALIGVTIQCVLLFIRVPEVMTAKPPEQMKEITVKGEEREETRNRAGRTESRQNSGTRADTGNATLPVSGDTLWRHHAVTRLSEYKPVNNRAFQVGEHLVFDIGYGFIKAGTATMSIPDTQWVAGRPCYHIVTTARSNKFISVFYKVRDRLDAWIDLEGIFPWKLEKHIREGRYSADRYAFFDQVNQRVISGKDTLEVSQFIQEVLCSFYYVRTRTLKVGDAFDVDTWGDGKIYPLRVLIHRKERVKVPAGTFDCIVVEPVLRSEGIFKHQGKMLIWMTDDERKLPVQMKSKIPIGSISCRLREKRLH